jgi:hypothetical protein
MPVGLVVNNASNILASNPMPVSSTPDAIRFPPPAIHIIHYFKLFIIKLRTSCFGWIRSPNTQRADPLAILFSNATPRCRISPLVSVITSLTMSV